MTRTDLAFLRDLLRAKQAELSVKSHALQGIAIERSADVLDEMQYKSDRELAIVGLNRESAIRRSIELALTRIHDDSFGACVHCGNEISRRRLEAVPWTPFCIRCQEAADRGDETVIDTTDRTFLDAA
jgi:DnaK suppressor protein